jgi:hypothetical protein
MSNRAGVEDPGIASDSPHQICAVDADAARTKDRGHQAIKSFRPYCDSGPQRHLELMPKKSPQSLTGSSFFPPNDQATYRDLLLFEERLKTNALALNRRKSRYQCMFCLSLPKPIDISFHV